jgi:multimeric flavodoxin WrbA
MDISNKILGISGSPRKKGNSDVLLASILQGAAEQNKDTSAIYLRDYQFQSCIGCETCRKDKICTRLKDGMTLIYPDIINSQAMVWVSPTHTYNITALMKAFIDRLYCFYEFSDERPRAWKSQLAGQGRKAVIAAVCEQETKENMGVTLEAMRLPLKSLGYEIVEEFAVFGLFDRGIVKNEKEVLAQASEAGKKLALSL